MTVGNLWPFLLMETYLYDCCHLRESSSLTYFIGTHLELQALEGLSGFSKPLISSP